MAAFKDKKNGSWYVQFRYTDWRGERQQKLKRGFATKKEAQAWEREFLMQKQADVNMSFESFVALYEKDVKPKLKLLRVNFMHIGYVFDCLRQNTTYVRNIKKYLLASLFNAPNTMDSYYSALVNHDMYGDGLRGKG